MADVRLDWFLPDDGGSPITSQHVQVADDGPTLQNVVYDNAAVGASATSHTVTGLNAGTQYWCAVAATNSIGQGAWSNVATVTTAPVAGNFITPGPDGVARGARPSPSAGGSTVGPVAPSGLQAAINAAVPGDVIRVSNGTHGTTITLGNVAGTASDRITVWADNEGGVTLSEGMTALSGSAAYWTFSGLNFTSTAGTVSGDVVATCVFWVSNLRFEYCDIEAPPGVTPTPYPYAFYCNDQTNIVVDHCEVHGDEGTTGLILGHRMSGLTVSDCFLHGAGDNGGGSQQSAAVACGNCENVTVTNNRIEDVLRGMTHSGGFGFGGFTTGSNDNIKFVENDLYFDGQWNFIDGGPRDGFNMIQWAATRGTGCEISRNKDFRVHNATRSEDHINLAGSGGTDGNNPLEIYDNRVKGGFPSGSSTFIIFDEDQSGEPTYVHCKGNNVVAAGSTGIAIQSGLGGVFEDNKLVMLAAEGAVAASYGQPAFGYGANGAACSQMTVQNNEFYWVVQGGQPSGFFNGSCGTIIGWEDTQTNDLNATGLTYAIFDEPIPAP